MFRPTMLGLSRAIAQKPAATTTLPIRAAAAAAVLPRFYSSSSSTVAAAESQPTTTTTTTTTTTPSQSTTTTQPTTPTIQTQTNTKTAAPPTESKPAPPVRKPYLVGRAWTQRLPVYHLAKRGGNKKLTQIKKVQGDGQALRRDLAQFLGLEEKAVRVKVPTGHLEVDGHRREEVTKFLHGLGF
ncbi:mitochondrial large subunit ribosomal protein-domain-containing protein [Pseudoneurospora amorphoporcata]|uniref:Large ribosomal subunit protein mL49 n=1 Tax=Pseudoneurospora amorphoporcata TaxID=241081 RepID=A0AAN6NSQ0_9PEZI|nr:mitochondrial large subunit ribosomal protein-domain-containing protein [Pseudoneurospora amorphoporcata]